MNRQACRICVLSLIECFLYIILYSVCCFLVGEVVCIPLFTCVRCSILYKLQSFLAMKFLPFVFLTSLDLANTITLGLQAKTLTNNAKIFYQQFVCLTSLDLASTIVSLTFDLQAETSIKHKVRPVHDWRIA